LPCPAVQADIASAAHELAADPAFHGEISKTLSRRFSMPEKVIDRVVALRGQAFERGYNAQRTGMLNAMAIGGCVVQNSLRGR